MAESVAKRWVLRDGRIWLGDRAHESNMKIIQQAVNKIGKNPSTPEPTGEN
jgi:hypothetical protein